jgi:hypothetical protein
MKQIALFLPFLALGPVTGPLLALSAASFTHRRPILGLASLAGIATFWLGGPALLAAELSLLNTFH